MKRLYRFSHRGKSEVSVEAYAPILRMALDALRQFPTGNLYSESERFMPEEKNLEAIEQISDTWEGINTIRLNFEAAWPERNLQEVHTETVPTIRAIGEAINALGGKSIAQIERNPRNFKSAQDELILLECIFNANKKKIIAALGKVLSTNPELYQKLELTSSNLLYALNLKNDHPLVVAAGVQEDQGPPRKRKPVPA